MVASNYGAPASPHWYHNLIANPSVGVELRGTRFQALARVAKGNERGVLYTELVRRMPGFAAAQARARRQIPIIVLESRARGAPRQ